MPHPLPDYNNQITYTPHNCGICQGATITLSWYSTMYNGANVRRTGWFCQDCDLKGVSNAEQR